MKRPACGPVSLSVIMSGRSLPLPATMKLANSVETIVCVNPSGRTNGLYVANPASVAGGATHAADDDRGANCANPWAPPGAAAMCGADGVTVSSHATTTHV